MDIQVGIKGHDEVLVDETNVASAVGSGAMPVFSTPSLAASMERAALESVQPWLDEGQSTVGIRLELDHLAATPIGMRVFTDSELVEVDGRILRFAITARDACGQVAKCVHTRCIINSERFMAKATAKHE
ncbi:MAG: thioesterase family protein [Oscillospiraceae bacterium]|nr:thioesterase family protein [Oscillospiraceae bacterium]